jgi:hypothetical protein
VVTIGVELSSTRQALGKIVLGAFVGGQKEGVFLGGSHFEVGGLVGDGVGDLVLD